MKGRVRTTLGRYLCSGVTSVVALGAIPWEYEVREIARNLAAAPRVFLAGGFVGNSPPEESYPFWEGEQPGYWIENQEAAKALVAILDSTGVDFIKAGYVANEEYPLATFRPALQALVEESHARGLRGVGARERARARQGCSRGRCRRPGPHRLRSRRGRRIRSGREDFPCHQHVKPRVSARAMHDFLARSSSSDDAERRCGDPEVTEAWLEWTSFPKESRPALPERLRKAQVFRGPDRGQSPRPE